MIETIAWLFWAILSFLGWVFVGLIVLAALGLVVSWWLNRQASKAIQHNADRMQNPYDRL